MYTFKLNINDETHSFTARYSSLLEFHNLLFQEKEIQKSFENNVPLFPPKNWWLDFTKPENYSKRAHKLLKYFRIITEHESVLKNHIFQNGIYLPKHLRMVISDTIRGYYWEPLPKLPLPSPTTPGNRPPHEGMSQSPTTNGHEMDWPLTLEDKLDDLLKQTDEQFIDITMDGMNDHLNGWYQEPMEQQYWFIDELNLFCVEDILPKSLLNNHDKQFVKNGETQMQIQKMENVEVHYMELFQRITKRENEAIDDIVLDLRDAILESCDIANIAANVDS